MADFEIAKSEAERLVRDGLGFEFEDFNGAHFILSGGKVFLIRDEYLSVADAKRQKEEEVSSDLRDDPAPTELS